MRLYQTAVTAVIASTIAISSGLHTAARSQTASSANRPSIYSLAFSPDGKQLCVGTHGKVLVYETTKWENTSVITEVEGSARSLCYTPSGQYLAIGSGLNGVTGHLVLWDFKNDRARKYQNAKDTIENISFSKDGGQMLTASFDNKARIYPNTQSGYAPTLEEHNGRVTATAFSPKPNYIFITGSMDKMVKVWEHRFTEKYSVVANFDQPLAGVLGVGFLPNGDQFVGASLDGNIYWWGVGYDNRRQTYSGYHFRTIRAHEDGISAFGMSANLDRMVTSGGDKHVRVWRVGDGGQVRDFKLPVLPVYATALSADGKIAAAAGREGVVWVWDVEKDKLLTTITPPPPVITATVNQKTK